MSGIPYICSGCSNSLDWFYDIQDSYHFQVKFQIYTSQLRGQLPLSHEIVSKQLKLCQTCFDLIENKIKENKNRLIQPRVLMMEVKAGVSCSGCLKEVPTFQESELPHLFTNGIYEFRKKGYFPGANEIDPSQLRLCEWCLDKMVVRYYEISAKSRLPGLIKRLPNCPDKEEVMHPLEEQVL